MARPAENDVCGASAGAALGGSTIPAPTAVVARTFKGHGLEGIEDALERERPDCLLVYGDTNSSLAGALAAKEVGSTLVHIEAGLRCFDQSVPEERARIMIDSTSDYLFPPTELARTFLSYEQIEENVVVTGNLEMSGTCRFDGIIIVLGSLENGGGTTQVYGAVLLGPSSEQLRSVGTFDLRGRDRRGACRIRRDRLQVGDDRTDVVLELRHEAADAPRRAQQQLHPKTLLQPVDAAADPADVNSQGPEGGGAVGVEPEPGALLAQLGAALVDLDLVTLVAEAAGQGQPAHPGSDDDDTHQRRTPERSAACTLLTDRT